VETARTAVDAYRSIKSPTRAEQAVVATHAIRLARLDDVFRAWQLDETTFEEPAPEDVEDLFDMLAIVPFDSLLDDKVLLLNPTFGETSRLVGGADCDIITGDMLVDLKTTKQDTMQAPALDQLLGYFLLARHHKQLNPSFPEINRLGLYFCRHGYLWGLDATTWTEQPAFPEVELWFFQRAQELFGAVTKHVRKITPPPRQSRRRTGRK
jgi:hypothetical protein